MSRSASRARAEDAYRDHLDGYSWQEIADRLGFRSRQGAQTAVRRWLAENQPDGSSVAFRKWIDRKNRRRDRLTRQLTAAETENDHHSVAQLSAAIDRIDDQLAKAQGFYAPTQQSVSVSVDTSPVAAVADWQRQMHELALAGAHHPAALPSRELTVIDAEVIR